MQKGERELALLAELYGQAGQAAAGLAVLVEALAEVIRQPVCSPRACG